MASGPGAASSAADPALGRSRIRARLRFESASGSQPRVNQRVPPRAGDRGTRRRSGIQSSRGHGQPGRSHRARHLRQGRRWTSQGAAHLEDPTGRSKVERPSPPEASRLDLSLLLWLGWLTSRSSLLITTGDLYRDYLHGIAETTMDEDIGPDQIVNWTRLGSPRDYVSGRNVRQPRISLTYRDVVKVSRLGQRLGQRLGAPHAGVSSLR